MATVEPRPPVQPGEPAPDFMLPAVERQGTVSLLDYRGKSPLLLAINRGLWCSFLSPAHFATRGDTRTASAVGRRDPGHRRQRPRTRPSLCQAPAATCAPGLLIQPW